MNPQNLLQNLRDLKTDNNLLLLKTEMNAGHGGKSGRDGAIEEIALDYAFILKITKKITFDILKKNNRYHILFVSRLMGT